MEVPVNEPIHLRPKLVDESQHFVATPRPALGLRFALCFLEVFQGDLLHVI